MAKPFSSLCISLLTELLDLNSLEGLLDEQRESYVLKNIRTELGDDAARLEADIPVEDAAANINENGEKKEKKFHIRLIKSNSKGIIVNNKYIYKIIVRIFDDDCGNSGCSCTGHRVTERGGNKVIRAYKTF